MAKVKVIGVPYAAGCRQETSYAIDQHNAPGAIRRGLADIMSGYNIPRAFDDIGDVQSPDTVSDVLNAVEQMVTEVCRAGDIPLLLGGAHTLTLGSLRALRNLNRSFSLIYIDAHPDVMPHSQINYGSSLYYAFKEGVADTTRTALLGIRQIENEEATFIKKEGVFTVSPLEFEARGAAHIVKELTAKFPPPYFISIDLDGIDPSLAPGVTSPFPGGLTGREVLYLTSELCKEAVLGVEIVELAPVNDRNDETALLAAIILHTLSTTLAAR